MILYKYKQLIPKVTNTIEQSKKDVDRIEEILVDSKIYFSKPRKLNDIFEFRPYFKFPNTYKKRKITAKESIEMHKPNLSGVARQHEIRYLIEKLKDTNLLKKNFQDSVDGYGVFCVTAKPNSPIMWSHYAGNYTGVCIGFDCPYNIDDAKIDPDFGLFMPVNYQEEYPVIQFQGLDKKELIIKTVFTKSIEWKYEEEYRFAKAPVMGDLKM